MEIFHSIFAPLCSITQPEKAAGWHDRENVSCLVCLVSCVNSAVSLNVGT